MGNKQQDIGNMIGGLGISQSVTISRHSATKKYIPFIVVVIIILVLGFFVLSYVSFEKSDKLAQQLPQDTKIYTKLTLPSTHTMFSKLLIGQKREGVEKYNDIIKSLDILSWDNYTFSTDVLPIISNTIEFAQLKNNNSVLAVKLKNKDAWFSLFEMNSDTYNGKAHEINLRENKFWKLFIQEDTTQIWYVENDYLYIANNESIISDLQQTNESNVSDYITLSNLDKGLGILYLNSTEHAKINKNNYINSLLKVSEKPFLAQINIVDGQLVFGNNANELEVVSETHITDLQGLYESLVSDFGIYVLDIGLSYGDWRGIVGEQVLEYEILLDEFYGLSIASQLELMQNKELVFLIRKQENDNTNKQWAIIIQDDFVNVFKALGSTLFAINHPISVDKLLSDGTLMSELRLNIDNIEWGEEKLSIENMEIDVLSLQDAGFTQNYIISFVPELGTILTNSETLSSEVLNYNNINKDLFVASNCYINRNFNIGLSVKPNFLSSFFNNDTVFDKIVINNYKDNNINGCILLSD